VAERCIEVDGLRTRWLEEGRGVPLVLLHGASLGSSCDVWREALPMLAACGVHAIAPDLPGFGLTGNPDDHSLAFRTRFVPAFMQAIGVATACVLGHSQSGRIPVALALDGNDAVSAAIVVGTGSLLPPLPGASKGDGEGDEGADAEPTLAQTRALLEDNLHHREIITDAVLELRQRMSVGKNFAAFQARRAAKAADRGATREKAVPAWQRVGELAIALRLIYGREDRGHAAERVALARERHPALDIHLVDGARHLVHWDAPEAFTRLVADFVTRAGSPHSPIASRGTAG
jgi:pimeloyl-ACP methyl ester carboxylesterase